ncbi:UNVERIFIED_CONTAM: Kinesin-like protein KIN-12B [Sesamum latifolium]|uniref:Kinesin-like protein n=1 Tax=Sesamum latifolium TaxID=2727402 RepID=A0AAW2XDU4_9LAMI
MKSPLPPRPPLKRKLSVESTVAENCGGPANSLDSGVKSDIFELVGAPLVENCLAGFNSSVFAYGQTGSGKTYTIWGASNALLEEDQQGLAPRVFHRLFERIEEEQVKQADRQLVYMCRCSFLEIYNEQITDLLDPSQKNLQGLSNRRTSATRVNAESSRSHSVFTCVVESRSKSAADGLSRLKMSRINFVDLAGSERQKQTGAAGERLKEAGNINRSLSQLGAHDFLSVVSNDYVEMVSYEKESLGGNAKLAMICAVSPSQSCKSETLSTLRFAQRAKAIKNKAVVNEEMQDDVNVLREVIRQLRDELHRMKANNDQTGQTGAYATGWSARRSLNLLRFSLNRPMMLPHVEDDSDEEMEIVDTDETMPVIPEERCVRSPEQGYEDTDVNMEDATFETVDQEKVNIISHELRGRESAISLERKSEMVLANGSCGQSEDVGFAPSVVEKLQNDDVSRELVEQCPSIRLSADAENTPDKATSCIEDGTESNLRIVPIDVSPVLKSPTPSVSPRLDSSRKSLRTSSTAAASQSIPTQSKLEAAHASIAKPSNSICFNFLSNRKPRFASTQDLAATLHRGLEIIESKRLTPALRRSSFRFSCMPADVKTLVPVVKIDVGVQTVFHDDESTNKDPEEFLCSKCKTGNCQQELIENDDGQNMQLVPVSSPSHDQCKKQVPKAVEKVLTGAIRREMALEEMCAKQNSEIMQLNRLIQQYKHERECNAIIGQTREDKIARLESLMDGILPTEEFMEEELLSLTHEHKILREQYDNHPDVLRTNIELKRVQEELERYQNFFDLGERDVLLEEIQDLRTQLQFYLDSSSKTSKKQTPLLQLTSSCEPSMVASLSTTPDSTGNSEETLRQERIQWTEAESKWISLVEELRMELEASRSLAQKQKKS